MKRPTSSSLWLAAVLALGAPFTTANAAEALTLKVAPEREVVLRSQSRDVIVQIELEAQRAPDEARRTPVNLAIVLDRSGSMAGAKLEKARQAAALAVDRLSADDTFSVVLYDDRAEVLIPSRKAGDKAAREEIKHMIHRIQPGGGTALHAGVKLGARELRSFLDRERLNRVILLSDGLANVGPSRPGDLAELGRDLRRDGMSVSTIGLGDDYNEDLMTALAEASHANYYYVKDAERLPGIFAEELGAARSLCARDVRIRIETPRGVRVREIVGYPEIKCDEQRAEIVLPEYFSSDKRRFLARCSIEGTSNEKQEIAAVTLRYDDAQEKRSAAASGAVSVRLTDTESDAIASIRSEVSQEYAVQQNRVDKEAALRLADSGRAKDAAQLIRRRVEMNAAAPAASQAPDVQRENAKLNELARELEDRGTLSKSSRKATQYDNWKAKRQLASPYSSR